jgi:ATP-dependent RNA helicase DOB1
VTSDVLCFLEYKEKLEELQNIQIDCEGQIASYYNIRQQLDKLGVQFRNYITKPNYLIPFLQPGRLVKVSLQFL